MKALATGLDGFNFVDNIRAGNYFAKNGVTPPLGTGRGVIQESVVRHIDKELRRGGMWVTRARHV